MKLTPEEMAELESNVSADALKGNWHGCTSITPTYKDSEAPPVSSWKPS